jgi:polyhydroxyalkanoate synthesis regulator phasin
MSDFVTERRKAEILIRELEYNIALKSMADYPAFEGEIEKLESQLLKLKNKLIR